MKKVPLFFGIILFLGSFGLWVYGLYLCFSASIIIGLICLLIEPSPLLIGIIGLFGKNIPAALQAWINFPL